MRSLFRFVPFLLQAGLLVAQESITLDVVLSTEDEIASDKAVFYYPPSTSNSSADALLVGNDGGATGGFNIWTLPGNGTTLTDPVVHKTGRTKLVGVIYGVGGKDWIVTLAQSDSWLRLFDIETDTELESARIKVWGDYSALCGWRATSGTGAQYLYIFGKKIVKIYTVLETGSEVEIFEVQTVKVPIEAEGCVVSQAQNLVYFAGSDGNVYAFPAAESTTSPDVRTILSGTQELSGLTIYQSQTTENLALIYEDRIDILDSLYRRYQTLELSLEDYELSDATFYQQPLGSKFPSGALAFAVESDEVTGFALSSIENLFSAMDQLGTSAPNTSFDPRQYICEDCAKPSCPSLSDCSGHGYCPGIDSSDTCECFAGFGGADCSELTCADDCSGRGTCSGPNICTCSEGWGGPTCSFQLLQPKFETEENGEDGDDPAIWISPDDHSLSRIITTTKSEIGAGFAVFDLEGKKLQQFPAGEPNNVDIIYGFPLEEGKTVDLIYAACREDNTLCFAQITGNGTLAEVPGASHSTPEDYEVYGSCVYKSKLTSKFYVFVNAKDATYLQYELTSANGTLSTTLIRSFRGGSGGQVEGCVVDDENAWIIIGEEPYGLWRYDAEPPEDHEPGEEDENALGYLIDSVDGNLFADVEGVTLVHGTNATSGLIIVSCQGLSAYNVYRRAPPHQFLKQFQITESIEAGVDRVSNTDGVAAVGTKLNDNFPAGIIVVHDDVNEAPDGSVSEEAAFKLISLADLLDDTLRAEINTNWDPRT